MGFLKRSYGCIQAAAPQLVTSFMLNVLLSALLITWELLPPN